MVARLSPAVRAGARMRKAVVMFLLAQRLRSFAATVGPSVQNDNQAHRWRIRPVHSSATCFVAMGGGGPYSVGMFHLFTHAFFQGALLFLGLGLGDLCDASRAGHPATWGGLKDKISLHLHRDGDRHAGAGPAFPLTAGLFLQGTRSSNPRTASHNPLAMYGFVMTVIAAGTDLVLFRGA